MGMPKSDRIVVFLLVALVINVLDLTEEHKFLLTEY
jgi:hypothetical protein